MLLTIFSTSKSIKEKNIKRIMNISLGSISRAAWSWGYDDGPSHPIGVNYLLHVPLKENLQGKESDADLK